MKYNSNEMIHIKNGEIEYLKFKILEKYSDKVNHIITLKHGGVSKNEVSSLNLRTVGNDKKENNIKNLELVCNEINLLPENVHKGKQNHTDKILILDNDNKEKYRFDIFSLEEYDAYITKEKNIASLVTTADCNPIIIYDPVKNIIANVHSGWKGTIKRIYLKVINTMIEKFNSNAQDLIFCIGPSIKKCCFTSEEKEFKDLFTSIWQNEEEYIYYEENNETFHIDLSYVIKKDILKKGIKEENIAICDICTMCNHEDFYSYRYATKHKYEDYGTFATIAYLK
jgi:YfiH family protein